MLHPKILVQQRNQDLHVQQVLDLEVLKGISLGMQMIQVALSQLVLSLLDLSPQGATEGMTSRDPAAGHHQNAIIPLKSRIG